MGKSEDCSEHIYRVALGKNVAMVDFCKNDQHDKIFLFFNLKNFQNIYFYLMVYFLSFLVFDSAS